MRDVDAAVIEMAQYLCSPFEDDGVWEGLDSAGREDWLRAGRLAIELERKAHQRGVGQAKEELLAKAGPDELSIRLDLNRVEKMCGKHPGVMLAEILAEYRSSLSKIREDLWRMIPTDLREVVIGGIDAKIAVVSEYMRGLGAE